MGFFKILGIVTSAFIVAVILLSITMPMEMAQLFLGKG